MPEYLTMIAVVARHVRSLRGKSHRHAAVAFHLAAISEAVENLAILADLCDLSSAEVQSWAQELHRQTLSLKTSVDVPAESPTIH